MSERNEPQPTSRCARCFEVWQHNHTPQPVVLDNGVIAYMHKKCKADYLRDLPGQPWPAVKVVRPPRDE